MKLTKKQENIKIFRLKSRQAGFSILELMMAVFVLTIGIVGTLQLISSTIRNSMDTRNAVIATGLAQEGVELVRNIRDNSMLYALADLSRDPDVEFKKNLSPNDTASYGPQYGCVVPSIEGHYSHLSCADNIDFTLYLHSPSDLYIHAQGSPFVLPPPATIFKRSIGIAYESETINGSPTPQLSGMNVVSTVWWNGDNNAPATCNLANKCIFVEDYLAKRD